MKSLLELYRIGLGPSSSHTMGPAAAASTFRDATPEAVSYRVTLYGSLAATGRGHLTDAALVVALAPRDVAVIWLPDRELSAHPNGLEFEALDGAGRVIAGQRVYSVGGGAVQVEGEPEACAAPVYALSTMAEIMRCVHEERLTFWEYVRRCDDTSLWLHLERCWEVMRAAIARGIDAEGVLLGGLNLPRKAGLFFRRARGIAPQAARSAYISAYALAVAEENAAGGMVVTAPTCGACGVMPAVLHCLWENSIGCDGETIVRALATGGLIGNLVKHNASISGAEVGCQGEIGTGCAMAAAAAAQLLGGTPSQIEYAAEMGLEHHLGLTCDPVKGLVQIPCIERNVFAALRALHCAEYALASDGTHQVPFDDVVAVMLETGHALPPLYRETSRGGLAARLDSGVCS